MDSKKELINEENMKDNEVVKEKKTSFSFIATCVLVLIAFFSGFYFNDSLWKTRIETIERESSKYDLQLLWQVVKELSDSYVDPDKMDKQKMIYGIIQGAVNSLGDPYTAFFNPDESKSFKDDISGTFMGVGIQIGTKNNQLKVIAPIKGTPA